MSSSEEFKDIVIVIGTSRGIGQGNSLNFSKKNFNLIVNLRGHSIYKAFGCIHEISVRRMVTH